MRTIWTIVMSLIVVHGYATAAGMAGERIAVLITDGFHDEETEYPIDYFTNLGATVTVIGPQTGEVEAYNSNATVTVEKSIDEVAIDDFDALIIPGGHSPGNLVNHDNVVAFARDFFLTGKPVAAICHGPLVLIAADVVDGYRATAYHSVSDELEEAGADYTNQEVVVDRNLITSRQPDDLPAFVEAIAEALSQQTTVRGGPAAVHHGATASLLTEGARLSVKVPGSHTIDLVAANGRRVRTYRGVDAHETVDVSAGVAPGMYRARIRGRAGHAKILVRR
jgi:protease I